MVNLPSWKLWDLADLNPCFKPMVYYTIFNWPQAIWEHIMCAQPQPWAWFRISYTEKKKSWFANQRMVCSYLSLTLALGVGWWPPLLECWGKQSYLHTPAFSCPPSSWLHAGAEWAAELGDVFEEPFGVVIVEEFSKRQGTGPKRDESYSLSLFIHPLSLPASSLPGILLNIKIELNLLPWGTEKIIEMIKKHFETPPIEQIVP